MRLLLPLKPGHVGGSPLVRIFALGSMLLVTAGSAARADKIDDYVAAQMNRQHIPGLSLAVLKDGEAVKVKGYGFANLELDTRATPQTVYQIGSMSKQFIAAGIVLLSDEGKLRLDDSIRKHLADAPDAWQPITVRHALTHTSGLVRETPDLQLTSRSDIEAIRAAYATPLSFQPGEKWQYSNLGYFVLAEIISRVTQIPWPQYLQERIFGPLQMSATRTTSAEELIQRRASGYHWMDTDEYHNAQIISGVRPSGAFLSTALDLAKWDATLYSTKVLSPQQRELMWTPVKLNDGSEKPYGFGWEVGKLNEHRQVKHAGTMFGFRSQMLRFPDDGLTIVVLTNATQATPEKIALGLAGFYIQDLKPQQSNRVATKLSALVLDDYVGRYQITGNRVLTVARREGNLAVAMPLQGLGKEIDVLMQGVSMQLAFLTPETETRFFDEESPNSTYVFARDAEGKMELLVENTEGKVLQRASKIGSQN